MMEACTAVIIGAVGLGIILGAINELVYWRSTRAKVRAVVFANLDSARANGYFEPSEHLHGMTPFEVANDLTIYAEDCSGYLESELEPYVREWLEKHP